MKPGSFEDPVARSIRNEQNRDAAPSPEEQEQLRQREIETHKQWKAIERQIEVNDWPMNYDVVMALADYHGYDELASVSRHSWKGTSIKHSFRERHIESHEIDHDDDPAEERYHRRTTIPWDERYGTSFDPGTMSELIGPDDVRSGRKILNPFAAKKARVIAIVDAGRVYTYTNETFDRAMDSGNWAGSFDEETIGRYQEELRDLHERVVPGGDA